VTGIRPTSRVLISGHVGVIDRLWPRERQGAAVDIKMAGVLAPSRRRGDRQARHTSPPLPASQVDRARPLGTEGMPRIPCTRAVITHYMEEPTIQSLQGQIADTS
jgi:hypothetical protein